MLDNARDAEQVRPLLPGAPGCLAVVTSRNRLTGLVTAEGARPLALDLLGAAEARELLVRRLGTARVAAEPEAVAELHHLGRYRTAAGSYRRALTLFRAAGDRYHEAHTLTHAGDTYDAAGDVDAARSAWRHAVSVLDDIDHPDAEAIRGKLDKQRRPGRRGQTASRGLTYPRTRPAFSYSSSTATTSRPAAARIDAAMDAR